VGARSEGVERKLPHGARRGRLAGRRVADGAGVGDEREARLELRAEGEVIGGARGRKCLKRGVRGHAPGQLRDDRRARKAPRAVEPHRRVRVEEDEGKVRTAVCGARAAQVTTSTGRRRSRRGAGYQGPARALRKPSTT